MLTNLLAQSIPWVIKRTIEHLGGRHEHLLAFVGLIAGLALAQAAIRVISRVAIFTAGRDAEYRLRRLIFAHLCQLDGSFYRRFTTGDLMSRLTNDLTAVRAMFGPGVLHAFNTVFAYAVAVPLMVHIDPLLTALALLPYPVLLLGARRFARGIYHRSHLQQQALSVLTSTLQEDLGGIRELKSFTLETYRAHELERASLSYQHEAIRMAAWRTAMMPLVGLGAGASLLLIVWLGGRQVIAGRLTLGDLVALNLYVGMLAWPTMALGWMISLWQRGVAAWERLHEILLTPPRLVDRGDQTLSAGPLEVELRHLDVKLGERVVLQDVSAVLPAGAICAVVGRVGSGKTTVAETIARLIEVPSGCLFYNGHDATELSLEQLRRHIAYAPQDAFLFSDTLRNNIAHGLADTVEEEDERARLIEEAIHAAGLEADLASLPEGVDTVVGERGIALSGGQRQRVALARALVAQRPLLILDDSLSAVDAETERRILERLRQALHGSTALLISHRLSALQHADHVFVLDGGQVVERGAHNALIARQGLYSQLYQRQLLAQELRS